MRLPRIAAEVIPALHRSLHYQLQIIFSLVSSCSRVATQWQLVPLGMLAPFTSASDQNLQGLTGPYVTQMPKDELGS
jgi:hypothetical protein